MKIFVSYSRIDAGDFANQIHRHLSSVKYDIFTDVNSIQAGEIWSNTIEENISNCDIFVVIVTSSALLSPHVEREVLQAQKENKKIIPCFFRRIKPNKIKWGLEKIHGVEFDEKYELSRDLYSKIYVETDISSGKGTDILIESTSKTLKDVKNDATTLTKSDVDRLEQKKKDLHSIPKVRIGALGSEVSINTQQSVSNHITDSKIIKYIFQKSWSTELQPQYVTIDPKGYIYVDISDSKTVTYKKFFQEKQEYEYYNYVYKLDGNGNFITKWGSNGTGKGEFDTLRCIFVDSEGSVYVADANNHRIQKFDGNGNFITKWGSNGTGKGEFNLPWGIFVDSEGSVYVADTGNHRIQKFDSNGTFITKWGSNGTGKGEFKSLRCIFVDSEGSVYVADANNHRIQKFDGNGNFITKWGKEGNGDGQFNSPWGLSIDSEGSVYVADTYNHRIQKFDSNGTFITKWGSNGTGKGEFNYPQGIAVDSSTGNVYVADTRNDRIQIFAPSK